MTSLLADHLGYTTNTKNYRKQDPNTPYRTSMPGSNSTKATPIQPEEKWVAYRENGEVKYVRESEAIDFNSAGGVAKKNEVSGWSNLPSGPFTANNPNLLPERYTDDSIIAVIVTDVEPSKGSGESTKKQSFLSKLKPGSKVPSTTKSVWMPRSEYKKFFAKDKQGNYIGTEPPRTWSEDELDDEFGQYDKDFKPSVGTDGLIFGGRTKS